MLRKLSGVHCWGHCWSIIALKSTSVMLSIVGLPEGEVADDELGEIHLEAGTDTGRMAMVEAGSVTVSIMSAEAFEAGALLSIRRRSSKGDVAGEALRWKEDLPTEEGEGKSDVGW